MNVLVLNCGSSSVKFEIIETDLDLIQKDADRHLANGSVQRIGSQATVTFQTPGSPPRKVTESVEDYRQALTLILDWAISADSGIESVQSAEDIQAAGHRVVHGGEEFRRSALIDRKVLAKIEDCIELAPLHNPANIKGIRVATELFGSELPQVAVFDTAFHSTVPESAYMYGIPYDYYGRHKVRRYGFHGTSHRYVAYRYRQLLGMPREAVDIITFHLGNGCSACAIKGGKSINTSMGFTPLEGLLMGTHSGDVDPSIVQFLVEREGLEVSEVLRILNRHSGLLGVSGLTGDMQDLLEAEADGDRRAGLAIDVFCHRARGYLGRYLAEMGGADAVILTGGIGENSPVIREGICSGLQFLGLSIDPDRNEALTDGKIGEISIPESPLRAFVIPTDEELLIARDTVRVIHRDFAS